MDPRFSCGSSFRSLGPTHAPPLVLHDGQQNQTKHNLDPPRCSPMAPSRAQEACFLAEIVTASTTASAPNQPRMNPTPFRGPRLNQDQDEDGDRDPPGKTPWPTR